MWRRERAATMMVALALLSALLAVRATTNNEKTDLITTCSDMTCPEPRMEYRKLGRSGLSVSVLSYGAWVSFANQLSNDTAYNLMKVAYEGGINFFDNAETYADGAAESVMGEAIKRGIDEGVWKRSDLVISTKIFWGGKGPNDIGLSRKHIIEGMEKSLDRLQLDYVDIVFAHRYDPHTPMEEIVRSFNWLIDRGYAFYWGTSEWSAAEIERAYAVADRLGLIGPIAEQPQYNLLHRERVEVEYAPLYQTRGLGTTIWSPLASGVLSGKYSTGIPHGSRLSQVYVSWLKEQFVSGRRHGDWQEVLNNVRQLQPVAEQLSCTIAQLAIAWCVKNRHVSTVLFGATSVDQLKENLRALHYVDRLTPEVMSELDKLLGNKPPQPVDWTAPR